MVCARRQVKAAERSPTVPSTRPQPQSAGERQDGLRRQRIPPVLVVQVERQGRNADGSSPCAAVHEVFAQSLPLVQMRLSHALA